MCATCHQSRRERRRLHKLSTTVTTEVPTPTHQRAGQLTNIDDHRVYDLTGTGSVPNHQPHGWTGLANGGQCIQRDDELGSVLTGNRRAPDDRPHTFITELPTDHLAAVSDRTPNRGRGTFASNVAPAMHATTHGVAERHGGTSGPPAMTNTVISAVATIEKRPTSPTSDGGTGGREVRTPSPRPDVVQYEKFQYLPSRLPQQAGVTTAPRAMDTSPPSARRICPGWSASVMPVVAAATGEAGPGCSPSRSLGRPNCLQSAPSVDRYWQRPSSVRWTAAGSSSRRPETASRSLSATRSTSELYDDVRPRLGATHSIVF